MVSSSMDEGTLSRNKCINLTYASVFLSHLSLFRPDNADIYISNECQTTKHKVKLEATMTGSHSPNGLRDEPEVKMAWAQYISYFISAYESLGVDIWAGAVALSQ
jgi:hypothetical protein